MGVIVVMLTFVSEAPVLDMRLALRGLRATPVVTVVAILSLALGLGANAAVFSIVDSLLLRALPVERPDQLALLVSSAADIPAVAEQNNSNVRATQWM